MKNHKPWTVGVCTDRSDNAIFFPVIYCKGEKKWYGYTNQWVNNIEENIGSCRSGNTKRWSVARTGKKQLSDAHEVLTWLYDKFPINKVVQKAFHKTQKVLEGYLVNKLQSKIDTEPHIEILLPDGCLGAMFVFKTKTTARKFCGNKVELTKVRMINV